MDLYKEMRRTGNGIYLGVWLEHKMSLTGSCVALWSPAWGAILGGSGNFKRWDLVGESKSLGHDLEGYI
jgi:hypothetical protein